MNLAQYCLVGLILAPGKQCGMGRSCSARYARAQMEMHQDQLAHQSNNHHGFVLNLLQLQITFTDLLYTIS